MLALLVLVLLLVASASFWRAICWRLGVSDGSVAWRGNRRALDRAGMYLTAGVVWAGLAFLILAACSTAQLLALPVL